MIADSRETIDDDAETRSSSGTRAAVEDGHFRVERPRAEEEASVAGANGDESAHGSNGNGAKGAATTTATGGRVPVTDAVRAALVKLLRDERDTLFPELDALRHQNDERLSSIASRLADLEERLDAFDRRLTGIEAGSARLDRLEQLERALEALSARLSESVQTGHEEILGRFRELMVRLKSGMRRLDGRVSRYRDELRGQLDGMRADGDASRQALREALDDAKEAAGCAEARSERLESELESQRRGEDATDVDTRIESLRQEIMDSLETKLDELLSMVGKLSGGGAERAVLAEVDQRLAGIERDLHRLTGEVGVLRDQSDGVTAASERMESVQRRLTALFDELGAREESALSVRDRLLSSLAEVHELLRASVDRRDAKRGLVHTRVLELRDALRRQLDDAVASSLSPTSMWERLSGKPNGQLKISPRDVERFRALLGEVVEVLEFLIFEYARQQDGRF